MDSRQARAILGLPPIFSLEELEVAFRRCARDAHPDHQGDVRRFQDVVESRRVLAASHGRGHSPVLVVDDSPRVARWWKQRRRRSRTARQLL